VTTHWAFCTRFFALRSAGPVQKYCAVQPDSDQRVTCGRQSSRTAPTAGRVRSDTSQGYSAPPDERWRREPARGQRSTASLASLPAGSVASGWIETTHDS
jgi:hypothetical protein